jgi:hypothetical protein
VLLLQELRKDLVRVDFNKLSCADGEHDPVFIPDLTRVVVFAAAPADFPAFDRQRLAQRHGFDVLDFHFGGQRGHAMQLVHLAHGFIEDRGDDASVGVARRSDESWFQSKAANEAFALAIQGELQLQSSLIAGTATEAIVADLDLLFRVTMDSLVPGHEHKMRHDRVKMQETPRSALRRSLFAVRSSPKRKPHNIRVVQQNTVFWQPAGARGSVLAKSE